MCIVHAKMQNPYLVMQVRIKIPYKNEAKIFHFCLCSRFEPYRRRHLQNLSVLKCQSVWLLDWRLENLTAGVYVTFLLLHRGSWATSAETRTGRLSHSWLVTRGQCSDTFIVSSNSSMVTCTDWHCQCNAMLSYETPQKNIHFQYHKGPFTNDVATLNNQR